MLLFWRVFAALVLLGGASLSVAAPAVSVVVAATSFKLEQTRDELINMGFLTVEHERSLYEVEAGAHVDVEAAWELHHGFEWIASAHLDHAGTAERREYFRVLTPGWTTAPVKADTDDFYLAGIRSGVRWRREVLPQLSLHVDLAASMSEWRFKERISGLSFNGSSYSTYTYSIEEHENYVAADARAGVFWKITSQLEFVLDAEFQRGGSNENRQLVAGFRVDL